MAAAYQCDSCGSVSIIKMAKLEGTALDNKVYDLCPICCDRIKEFIRITKCQPSVLSK